MKNIIIIFLLSFSFSCSAAGLTDKKWPSSECNNCTKINVGKMQLKMDLTQVHEIFTNKEKNAVLGFCLTKVCDNRSDMLAVSEETIFSVTGLKGKKLVNVYKRIGVSNVIEFLKKIGTKTKDPLVNVFRSSHGVDRAKGYYRYQQNNVTVYWIHFNKNTDDVLYILKKDEIFSIKGAIDKVFVNYALSELSVRD